MYELYNQFCTNLQKSDKYRELSNTKANQTERILDFTSNDYLGLSRNKELLLASNLAGELYGVGATGSRLLSGNSNIFKQLECQIASDKNTETALVFNSGFQTNITVLACLLDSKVLKAKPIVFFDKLNHASLYQAVFLSGAELIRYNHNNITHLTKLLQKFHNDSRPKFIVTETIFGMDGDILCIQEIVNLAKQYKAFLYLDEAHATGLLGNHGYGLSTTISLKGIRYLIMGTFSKALGGSGGYVAGDAIVRNYIINKASGFIYSTANSPMVIGAALKAWNLVRNFKFERQNLFSLANFLREEIIHLGFDIGNSKSHIIPIIIGTESKTLILKEQLLSQGILVSAIRPPTVPLSTSRLRIALNINHNEENIVQLIQSLKNI